MHLSRMLKHCSNFPILLRLCPTPPVPLTAFLPTPPVPLTALQAHHSLSTQTNTWSLTSFMEVTWSLWSHMVGVFMDFFQIPFQSREETDLLSPVLCLPCGWVGRWANEMTSRTTPDPLCLRIVPSDFARNYAL